MAKKKDLGHDPREDGTCGNCGCDLSGSLGQVECPAAPASDEEAPASEQ